ncbi:MULTISPECIES: hypothetical protein [unclassified Curtobacterium]|nr:MULTISPECIES: hypothetical protein [unclassified Curtobacterium]
MVVPAVLVLVGIIATVTRVAAMRSAVPAAPVRDLRADGASR